MKKITIAIVIFLIIFAGFFRLYRIADYMEFLGDEGRDALIAREIINGDPTLLGPRSSAGDFYMGPFYYYAITPFLFFANYDPVGPAIMVAIFGIATVLLIYFVGQKFFNKTTAFIAAFLYSFSPLVLNYSHSSWNPNILPFFSLLLIYLVYLTVTKLKSLKYFFLSGLVLGICLQLHYLSLFLGITISVYIFIMTKKKPFLNLIKKYLFLIFGTLTSLSPLILFDFLNNFLNTRGLFAFLFSKDVSYSANTGYFQTIADSFFRMFSRLIFNFPQAVKISQFPDIQIYLWGAVSILTAISSIILLFRHKNKSIKLILFLWLFICMFLFGLYKKEIHDYLFTILFPLPFLLVGNLIYVLMSQKKWNRYISSSLAIILFISISTLFYFDLPFRYGANRQRDQVKTIAEFVLSKTDNKPYNFAILSPSNSDHAYRYYLDILGDAPIRIENMQNDPERSTGTSQLLVVCEDPACLPLGNPLFEIAAFGRAEIAGEWGVSVVKVYKLIHYENPKNTIKK